MVNNRTMRPCLLARFRLPRMLGGGKTTCCSYSSRGASSGRGPNSTTGFTVVPFLRCNVITCFPPVQLGRAGLLGCPELHHETGSSMTSGVSRRRTFSTTRAGWNSSTTAMNRSPYQYKQGQYNAEDPSVREYFYFVDHNGMLFLDDARMKNFTACFKEEKFLRFFFSRIRFTQPPPRKQNFPAGSDGQNQETSSTTCSSPPIHEYFPYVSLCGSEHNYIRCDSGTPFVLTNFSSDSRSLVYNNTGLTHPFNPASLYVASNGKLYHEFTVSKRAAKFALVKSSVADLISLRFTYGDGVVQEGNEDVVARRPVGYTVGDSSTVALDYSIEEVVEKALE